MKPLRVALLQILPQGSLEKNLQKGIKACEEAKKAGADIALFPEMWSSGYDMPKDPEEMRKKSVPADSDFDSGLWQAGGTAGNGDCHYFSGTL